MASMERQRHRQERHPSFSSTLLDAIYRSIDEGQDMASSRRATMWMEQEVIIRHNSFAKHNNSCLVSSDSSSSESTSSYYASQRPKQSRISSGYSHEQKPKREGGFVKTKSRALKMYGDLKKVKQPISPGGRLASFLNSIFTSGNAKKAKTDPSSDSYMKNSSPSSSASSFSRSCLSKTPSSSRGQSAKRSVRFCLDPVPIEEELKSYHVSEEKRRVQEAARDLLKTYRQIENQTINFLDDDDDDDASCASSDLFELDNLSAIGQELPVYETTHLGTNRAIANGLIT